MQWYRSKKQRIEWHSVVWAADTKNAARKEEPGEGWVRWRARKTYLGPGPEAGGRASEGLCGERADGERVGSWRYEEAE